MTFDTSAIEFNVAPVKQATAPLREIPYPRAVELFLQDFALGGKRSRSFRRYYAKDQQDDARGFLESCSRYHGKLVDGVLCHPLLGALHLAFADHRPVCLSPDIIWLTLTQGLANHVNMNAEKLRRQFVQHDGKLKLEVRRDGFVKGSPENPWSGVFSEFSQKIKEHIGPAHELIVADYSTTGPVERAASEVVLLDAMQSYFEYKVYTLCGIPRIMLEGSAEDWESLGRRVQQWSRFDLEWWVKPLQPILDQFAAAVRGRIDKEFWDSIYKWNGAEGSGTEPYVSGWILTFFPYLNSGGSTLEQNSWINQPFARGQGPGLDSFPQFPAHTPFKWKYLGQDFEMEFVGGLLGVRQDQESLALRPEIGWAVLDKSQLNQFRDEQIRKERADMEERAARERESEIARKKHEKEKLVRHKLAKERLDRVWANATHCALCGGLLCNTPARKCLTCGAVWRPRSS
jgi:hypothetical protein